MRKQPLSSLALSLLAVWLAFWLRFDRLASVPFSWHLDEAAHGLEARDILAGARPIFFEQFTGHEASFIYAVAGAFALFGDSIWSARLVSATAGLLTVALTIPLCALLWPGGRGRRIGQWAALLLAASLWHLIESRNSYRAIFQPLAQVLALVFLFKALRASKIGWRVWLWWALAGFFIGANLHTYIAARAFPLVAVVVGLAAVLLGPARWPKIKGLALAAFVSGLVILPLALYFYNNPFGFYGRASDISIWTPKWTGGDAYGQLWRNVWDTLGMFMSRGDPSYKHNIGGRPVFDPFMGILFFIGLAYVAWGVFVHKRRLVSLTLLSWLFLMLLPMVLSAQGVPHFLRSIGVLPAVMIFPAIWLEWLWSWAARFVAARVTWPGTMAAAEYALLIPFLSLGLAAYPHYFDDWHNVLANDIERVVQAAYFMRDVQPTWRGEPVYLSSSYPEQITLAYLDPVMYGSTHGFDNRQTVPLPPEGRPTDYYILLEDQPNLGLLQKAGLRQVRTVTGRFGQPVYDVYHFDGRWPTPTHTQPLGWGWETAFPAGWQPNPLSAPVNFQDNLSLTGYDYSAETVKPGDVFVAMLYWTLNGPADGQYMFFVHVLDADSQVAFQHDDNRYPSLRWRAGEMLVSELAMTAPPDLAAGPYQVEAGVYHLFTGERMAVRVNGDDIANRVFLQPITVR